MKLLQILSVLLAMCFTNACFAKEKVVLTPENTVILRGKVSTESVSQVMHQIMTSPQEKLYLFISSPGGSIIDGLRLVNLLHNTDKDVTCITNMAASMAFVILQACPHRLVTEDAIVMQHVASYALEGQEPNNHSMASFIRHMTNKMAHMQADRIGISYDKFKELTRDDWWLFDGESVKANVADGSVNVVCGSALAKGVNVQTVQALFFSVEVTYSNCPLIEGPLSVKASGALNTPKARQEYSKFLNSLDLRSKLLNRYQNKMSNNY